MVAKTYQKCPVVGEPYEKNDKMYILVATKTNPKKEVRWYSELEYAKMYHEPIIDHTDYKKVFGFDKGYITIFRNDSLHEDFFKASIARYATFFGWYIVSTDLIPDDLPEDVKPIRLYWEDICENGTLMDRARLKNLVAFFKE